MKMLNGCLKFKTPDNGHYFFGYYDKSPFSYNDEKLLAMRVEFINRMPDKDDILEIGYFKWRNNNTFIKLSETGAWNWQQGCMLQWSGLEFEKNIIYNDRISNKFVSVLLDIETGEKTILPMAIYTMRSDGKYALCIDNERHFWFRGGYGYQGVENPAKNCNITTELVHIGNIIESCDPKNGKYAWFIEGINPDCTINQLEDNRTDYLDNP